MIYRLRALPNAVSVAAPLASVAAAAWLSSFAARAEAGPENACASLDSPRAVLACAKARAPAAIVARATVAEREGQAAQARERTNPQAYVQAFRSGSNDPAGDAVQASLLFPLDVWGARSARAQRADAHRAADSMTARLTEEDVVRDAFLALHRIRLTREFVRLAEEQRAAMNDSMAAFKRRASLAPEQEAMRLALESAASAEAGRLTILRQELEGLAHDLSVTVGTPWEPTDSSLPAEPRAWPTLSLPGKAASAIPSASDSSPRRARAASKLAQALAAEDLARAERRPSIAAGPSAEWTRAGDQAGVRAGVSLQFGLPILESRAGSAQAAAAEAARARAEAEGELRIAKGDADHAAEVYRGSVERLATLDSRESALRRLRRARGLFARGVLSSSSYLEVHRQTRELLQTRADLELRALDARCVALGFEGRFEECLP